MKVLVTGGDSKFAKNLKNSEPNLFYTPNKIKLNLLDPITIKRYSSIVSEIDGLILNANLKVDEPQDWFDVNQTEHFKQLFDFYVLSTTQLLEQYASKLKFVIALTTGLTNKKDRVGHSYTYVYGKELLVNHLFRLSCQKRFEHIKMININPGPMVNDEDYEKHSKFMCNIINDIDDYENGETYNIIGKNKL